MILHYFVLTTLFLATKAARIQEKKCLFDSECKESEYCKGFCAPKPTSKPVYSYHECQTSKDCGKDEHCKRNCIGISPIGYCIGQRKCYPNIKPPKIIGCQTDYDCGKDEHCKPNCINKSPIGRCIGPRKCYPNIKPPKVIGCRHNYDCKWTEGEACNIKVKTEDLIEG